MIPSEWISKIIRISSVTEESNEGVVHFLKPLLEESGLSVELIPVVEKNIKFFNVLAHSHAGASASTLALHTHLDTVGPGDPELWTKSNQDPFQATTTRERIYGLGTADVKLDFLCKLMAVRLAKPWSYPFTLVGTFGEERGLVGAWKLAESGKLKFRRALVGEPSNLALVYAHKAHVIGEVEIDLSDCPPTRPESEQIWKGRAAHSSTPHLGENAIVKALHTISKKHWGLSALSGGTGSNSIPAQCRAVLSPRPGESTQQLMAFFRWTQAISSQFKKRTDRRFRPAHPTFSINLARMEGKTLVLTFDARLLPDMPMDNLVNQWKKQLDEMNLTLRNLSMDPPLKGNRQSPWIKTIGQCLKQARIRPSLETKASSTEAAIYQKAGAEAVVFGPRISVGNVHRPNEHMLRKHLPIATLFYQSILQNPHAGGAA